MNYTAIYFNNLQLINTNIQLLATKKLLVTFNPVI